MRRWKRLTDTNKIHLNDALQFTTKGAPVNFAQKQNSLQMREHRSRGAIAYFLSIEGNSETLLNGTNN